MNQHSTRKMSGVVIAVAAAVAAATGHAADATGDGPRIEKVVVRADALFDFDRDVVRSDDQEKILAELGRAGKVTWQSVDAVGYTDSVGAPQYNVALSKRRADAVKAFLVGKGVDGGMITTAGRGPADPVADNDSDEGRARNRRTAIEFQGVRANE